MTIAAAAPLAVALVGLHRPRRLAHGVEHAGEVDADRLVPALGVVDVDLSVGVARAFGRPEAVADIEPGIGEADVEPAERRDVIVERLRHLREVGDVARVRARLVAFGAQPRRLALGTVGIDVGQRDLRARPRPCTRHRRGRCPSAAPVTRAERPVMSNWSRVLGSVIGFLQRALRSAIPDLSGIPLFPSTASREQRSPGQARGDDQSGFAVTDRASG